MKQYVILKNTKEIQSNKINNKNKIKAYKVSFYFISTQYIVYSRMVCGMLQRPRSCGKVLMLPMEMLSWAFSKSSSMQFLVERRRWAGDFCGFCCFCCWASKRVRRSWVMQSRHRAVSWSFSLRKSCFWISRLFCSCCCCLRVSPKAIAASRSARRSSILAWMQLRYCCCFCCCSQFQAAWASIVQREFVSIFVYGEGKCLDIIQVSFNFLVMQIPWSALTLLNRNTHRTSGVCF